MLSYNNYFLPAHFASVVFPYSKHKYSYGRGCVCERACINQEQTNIQFNNTVHANDEIKRASQLGRNAVDSYVCRSGFFDMD